MSHLSLLPAEVTALEQKFAIEKFARSVMVCDDMREALEDTAKMLLRNNETQNLNREEYDLLVRIQKLLKK